MPTPKKLLATAVADFTKWRKTKSHSSSPTPEPLRQQAVMLLAHFLFTRVTTTLRLSSSLLRDWSKQLPIIVHAQQPYEFVPLPSPEQPKNPLALELILSNGDQMRLSGDISPEQLNIVTRNIFMYQSGTTK